MRALLCGTKLTSIARFLSDELMQRGWEVILFSRGAWPAVATEGMRQIFRADLQLHASNLVATNPDLIVMSADSGGAFGNFAELDPTNVRNFCDSKVSASLLLLRAAVNAGKRTKIVFLCGKNSLKPAEYLAYHAVNAAIMAMIEECNAHYGNFLEAYYLETPVIAGSTIANEYLNKLGGDAHGFGPDVLIGPLLKIVDGTIPPGFVPFQNGEVA